MWLLPNDPARKRSSKHEERTRAARSSENTMATAGGLGRPRHWSLDPRGETV